VRGALPGGEGINADALTPALSQGERGKDAGGKGRGVKRAQQSLFGDEGGK